jgi:glutathione S-transferase
MPSSLLLQGCKLSYFPATARAEAPRLALAIGNIEFTDERIAFPEWKELKPTTPFGSMPILTLPDGTTKISQQKAILRLVGKETGLYPTDDHAKAAKIDSLMDALEDIQPKTFAAGQGMEKEAKEAERKKVVSEGGAVYGILSNVDKFIASNGSGGYAVGDSLTIADLFVYTMSSTFISGMFDGVPLDSLEPFADISAVRKTVRSHPAVTKWYDELKVEVPPSFGVV